MTRWRVRNILVLLVLLSLTAVVARSLSDWLDQPTIYGMASSVREIPFWNEKLPQLASFGPVTYAQYTHERGGVCVVTGSASKDAAAEIAKKLNLRFGLADDTSAADLNGLLQQWDIVPDQFAVDGSPIYHGIASVDAKLSIRIWFAESNHKLTVCVAYVR